MEEPRENHNFMLKIHGKLKTWLFIAAALVISGFIVWKFIQQEQAQMPDIWKDQIKNIRADLTLEKVKYSRVTEEGTKWTVVADTARLYEDSDIMDMDNVTITLLKKNGTKTVIVSLHGSYDRKNELITLKDDVIVKFESGERLYANILDYDQKKQVVWSDEPVVLRRDDGLVITAKKMQYYVDKGLIILKDQESIIPDDEV